MTRTKLFFAFALVFVPLAVLTSAPAPTDKIRLTPAGKVKVDNLVVNDAALIDENRVVMVGRTGDAEDLSNVPALTEGVANGAIIDLAKKSSQHFANQHPAQIWGVSSHGGRVVTVSTGLDGFLRTLLRSWDLKRQESKEVANLGETAASCRVRCFHKSDRVVLDAVERLFVFDPAKPKERMELACPAGVEHVSYPLAVSPNDAWIACSGSERDQVVCFEVATKKATVVAVTPKDAEEKWFVGGFAFSPSGKLFVRRYSNSDEVPEGKAEKDVPAERRGVVRIDLPDGKVVPLGMGHTCGTSGCAVDGTETWLATVGRSRPDQPKGNSVGELRVYNLVSGKLAYREQLKDGVPGWVWFSPSGKRLVCVTDGGIVRWWDVPMR
jgi:WD40 repeat protein